LKLILSEKCTAEQKLVNQIYKNSELDNGIRSLLTNKTNPNKLKSKFYKNATKIWNKLKLIYKPKNLNSIKNDYIYENYLLKDEDDSVFKKPGYYQNRGLPSYVPLYFKDLPVQVPQRLLKGIFKNLIPKINKAWTKIVFSNTNNDLFSLEYGDAVIDISELEFKPLYSSCLSLKRIEISSATKWQNEINVLPTEWDQIWENIHNSPCGYKVQSSVWQMIHRNFICAYFLKLIYNTDGKCKLCGKLELKRTHVFMKCEIIQYTYKYFEPVLKQLLDKTIDEKEKAFGIFSEKNGKIVLRNYITFVIRHVIFLLRNTDFTSVSTCRSLVIQKVSKFIKNDLDFRFKMAKVTNNINSFEKIFLIDNILGRIVNDNLLIYL